jgi:hypothetical protein
VTAPTPRDRAAARDLVVRTIADVTPDSIDELRQHAAECLYFGFPSAVLASIAEIVIAEAERLGFTNPCDALGTFADRVATRRPEETATLDRVLAAEAKAWTARIRGAP